MDQDQNQRRGGGSFYILIALTAIFLFYYLGGMNNQTRDAYTQKEFYQAVQDGNVKSVTVEQNEEVPTGTIAVVLKGESGAKEFVVSDVNKFQSDLKKADPKEKVNITVKAVDHSMDWLVDFLPNALLVGVVLFMMLTMMRQNGGGKMNDFGKSRAKLMALDKADVTFDDVAGLDEEKGNLQEVVDFLKNSEKYIELGARIPKGVLLVGPPGTGKTLIAKAVAGEAGVPFFSISGSDFVEMFVGVGASRVRDLFEEAKKNSPCIVFIDEIDAVGRSRGTGLGGGHDEREQTLNQLLVEMDGFGVNQGIIVLAATNRADILDPALMRPGRFDRKVAVGRPDVKGREEILKVHVRKKPLGDDVNLHEIARTTAGFVGADLENLMNEAAILAAASSRAYISKEDIDKAFIKVGIGTEKKSRLVPEHERKITAYHESGHALLFHLLPDVGPVYTVSIIPTGMGAAGYTMPLPENDNVFMTKGKLLQDIMVSLGGRIAEELIFDDVTTGASQDIKQVTETARNMVTKYGMSDRLGPLNYGSSDQEEVFLGKNLGHEREYGEAVTSVIDEEVHKIVDECYQKAKAILVEHMDELHRCAQLLLEKERINQAEFESIFEVDKSEIDELV